MRTAKSLSLLFVVGLSNAALVYGCSSEPQAGTGETPDGAVEVDSGREASSIVVEDAASPGARDAGKDAKKDSAKDVQVIDVIVDVVPDVVFDPPGSPCGPLSGKQDRPCGTCGTENRVCLKELDASTADASGQPGYWSPWSNCNTPPSAVCDPLLTYADEKCGNCGTRQRVCQLDCTYIAGLTCQLEGECSPGANDWEQGLGCNSPLGRTKTCTTTCGYDIAQTCSAAPPNPNNLVLASGAVGTLATKTFAINTITEKRVSTNFSAALTCPATLSSTMTVRQYIEVKNTTTAAMHVSIWGSKAATTPVDVDTVMAIYAGGIVPKTDAERQACVDMAVDSCDSTIAAALVPKACASNSAGMIKGDDNGAGGVYPGVLIPAKGSVTVYIAPYSGTTAGNIILSAQVEGP